MESGGGLIGIEGGAVTPGGPGDTCEFVGNSDGGLVEADALSERDGPTLEVVEGLACAVWRGAAAWLCFSCRRDMMLISARYAVVAGFVELLFGSMEVVA